MSGQDSAAAGTAEKKKGLVRRVTRGAGPPVRRTSSSRKEVGGGKGRGGGKEEGRVEDSDGSTLASGGSEDSGMYAVFVDTVSGIFGGCAGKAVEYPADTVKVKLQAQGNTGASYGLSKGTIERTEGMNSISRCSVKFSEQQKTLGLSPNNTS